MTDKEWGVEGEMGEEEGVVVAVVGRTRTKVEQGEMGVWREATQAETKKQRRVVVDV